MLEYNEVTLHKYIINEGEPFEVIGSHVFRKQQRKPVNAVKLKSLINGRVVEKSYHPADKVEEAEIEKKEVKFLYTNKGEYWFCEIKDPSKRFKLDESLLGSSARFLKSNLIVIAQIFDEKIFAVKTPVKVDLKVTEAPPAVKGDTAKGGTKQITLETGTVINAPLFITEGEVIRVNTETGDYVERVN